MVRSADGVERTESNGERVSSTFFPTEKYLYEIDWESVNAVVTLHNAIKHSATIRENHAMFGPLESCFTTEDRLCIKINIIQISRGKYLT